MKTVILISVLMTCLFSSANESIKNETRLLGSDSDGKACEVLLYTTNYGDGVFGLSASIRKSDGTYISVDTAEIQGDTLPLVPNLVDEGKCSFFSDDSLMLDGDTWILKRKRREFLVSWFDETLFTFKNSNHSPENISSIQVNQGLQKITVKQACKALEQQQYASSYTCKLN